ncbi:hypothetical protein HON22_02180 [Candidatus Peregrinibacteria bacterium]|jgi:hypothetical protein|nr:hypothetical protein [Candidatus Peregrinibacteria bacterium]
MYDLMNERKMKLDYQLVQNEINTVYQFFDEFNRTKRHIYAERLLEQINNNTIKIEDINNFLKEPVTIHSIIYNPIYLSIFMDLFGFSNET